ncbi:MAG: hypothetical protein U0736_15715 [Gemmataceae bacterium]
MHRIRNLVAVLLVAAVGLAGCANNENQIRPPKQPEEYRDPPDNDARYSGPIQYPAETMGEDTLLKRAKDKDGKMTPGGMNGMRGMGGGRMGGPTGPSY